jgi:hypothetical protein
VTWDSANMQLEINTSDSIDSGTYTVQVKSTLQVPNDYTKATFTDFIAITTVVIVVEDVPSCESTVFDAFPLEDMTVSVHGILQSFGLSLVQDSVSRAQGNGDGLTYCGAR